MYQTIQKAQKLLTIELNLPLAEKVSLSDRIAISLSKKPYLDNFFVVLPITRMSN